METFFKEIKISKQTLTNICNSFEKIANEGNGEPYFKPIDCEKLIGNVKKISNSKKRDEVINILNGIIINFLNYKVLNWIADKEFIKKIFILRKEGFLNIKDNPYRAISIATMRVDTVTKNMEEEICKYKENPKFGKTQMEGLIKEFREHKHIDMIKNFNNTFKDYSAIDEIGLEIYLQSVQAIKRALNNLDEIMKLDNFSELEESKREYLKRIRSIILECSFNKENKNRFLDKVLELEQKSDLYYDKKIINFFKENFPNEYEEKKEKIKIEKNIKILLLPCLNRHDKEGYLKKSLKDIRTRDITIRLIEEMYNENKCYIDKEKQEKETKALEIKKPGLFARIFGKKEKQENSIKYSSETIIREDMNKKIEIFFDKLKKEKFVNKFIVNEDGRFTIEFEKHVLSGKNKEEIKNKEVVEKTSQQKAKKVRFTEKYLKNKKSVKEEKTRRNETTGNVKRLVKLFEEKKENKEMCNFMS